MNEQQVIEEVSWYVLDAINNITASEMSFFDRWCMLKYYTRENNQPIEEHFKKTIEQVFNEYQQLNPELDVPISLVFDIYGFDINDFIIKQARVYFNYPA